MKVPSNSSAFPGKVAQGKKRYKTQLILLFKKLLHSCCL